MHQIMVILNQNVKYKFPIILISISTTIIKNNKSPIMYYLYVPILCSCVVSVIKIIRKYSGISSLNCNVIIFYSGNDRSADNLITKTDLIYLLYLFGCTL